MMVEPPFGLQLYNSEGLFSWLNYYATERNTSKGDCESASLTLCWYLLPLDIKCLAVQISGTHTLVYLPPLYYIDLKVGCVFNKNFSKKIKLSTFNEANFDTYWGENGLVDLNGSYNYIEVLPAKYEEIK